MADGQEFCLRWNDFHSSFHVSLEALRGDESFTDVTLSCSGHLFKAHRVILSACSSRFKDILKEVPPQQHPVIVLPTVERDVMRAILEFIYQGQVNVRQARLGAFLQVAETFAIQGLADAETKRNASKTPERPRAPDAVPAPTAKRRRLEQPQQPQPQQPPSPTVSGAGPPVQPPPPPPPPPPLRGTEKTVNLDLTVKPEPDSMLDELEEMLEPQSDQPLQDVSPLDGAQDAHGLMAVGNEDMGGSQASRDGLAAAMVAAVVGQSPGGGGSGGRASLPQRSLVREYFTGSGQDRLCRLCGHVLRLNRQLSTSGMWRHMRVKHPELVQPAEPAAGACRPEPPLLVGAGSVWSELAASSADGSSSGALHRIDGSTGVGSGGHEADWFFKS